MFPVLFSLGRFPLSSYGVFLSLGFLMGIFLVWRLCRAWDLDEERTLDLMLLTFLGGFFGARMYFVIEHLQVFSSPLNVILINKVPGLSFWGGVLGGWLTLYFLARKKHMNFWQLADIASVGLLGGLILSDIGCFLGGCSVGSPFSGFLAVTMTGSIGKRWPVQIVEALLLTLILINIWSRATHFHQRGKIVSLAFIYMGAVRLLLEPFRQDHSGLIFSAVFILLGFTIFYRVTRPNLKAFLYGLRLFSTGIFTDSNVRRNALLFLKKTWYNQKTKVSWKLRSLKKVLRRSNVKFS